MFVSTSDVVSLSSTADRDTDLSLPFATPTYPWKPQTLIAVRTPVVNTGEEGSTTFTFTVEMNFFVTFRGLRKSPIAYSPGPDPDPEPPSRPLQIFIDEPQFQEEYNDGPYNPVEVLVDVNVPPPKLDTSIVRVGNASPEVQVVKPRAGYDGLSEVSVYNDFEPPRLESKTVAYVSNGTYLLDPSSGFDGFSNAVVDVNVPEYATKICNETIISNGKKYYNEGPYRGVELDVNVPPYATESLNQTITENGPRDFNGPFDRVHLDVNVPPVIDVVGVTVNRVNTPFTDFEYATGPVNVDLPAAHLLIALRYNASGPTYDVACLASPQEAITQLVPAGFYYKTFANEQSLRLYGVGGSRVFTSRDEITDTEQTVYVFYSSFFNFVGIPVQ